MDFGSMLSNLAVNAGGSQIAGVEQAQRVANVEDTRAQTQMRQMQALSMKQEMADKADAATDLKAGMSTVQGGIKTQEDIIKGATATMNIAAQKGRYTEVKAMEDLIKGAQTEIKASTDAVAADRQAKAEDAGRTALSYQENPTPAAAAEVVRKAIAAGVPVEEIPPSTDKKSFDRWVDSLPGKARSVEKATEYKQAKDKAEADRIEKAREADQRNAAILEGQRSTAEARESNRLTQQMIAANKLAETARHNEAVEAEKNRQAEAKETAKASKGAKVGLNEQKVSDTVIRNSAQGVRVLQNMLELPGSAAQSLFAKIKDTNLTDSLIRTGGNIMTTEADQMVTAIGAEMGVIVGQVVTAGSGRGAALPIVDSFQKMTTPQKGDSQHMKLLRIANAGEILKLELKNITPGATEELEKSRTDMIKFLDGLPSTKDVIRTMPAGGRQQTMQQFMDLSKQASALQVKASALPREGEAAQRTGETKVVGNVTYHKTATGGWEHD